MTYQWSEGKYPFFSAPLCMYTIDNHDSLLPSDLPSKSFVNWKKELNKQRKPFSPVKEISTVLAPPLEGEIQPTQSKDFFLTASSLTEEIKKVQTWTLYRKLYRMVCNYKNLSRRDQKTFSCCILKKGTCKTLNRNSC